MTTGDPFVPEPVPDSRVVPYAPIPKPSGFAVASLVLGILGLFLSWITFGIPSMLAVVFGHVAVSRVRRGVGDGRGMAISGMVLGYLVIALFFFLVVAVGSLFALF
jgi:Domain of unknown function (DUF4190)